MRWTKRQKLWLTLLVITNMFLLGVIGAFWYDSRDRFEPNMEQRLGR